MIPIVLSLLHVRSLSHSSVAFLSSYANVYKALHHMVDCSHLLSRSDEAFKSFHLLAREIRSFFCPLRKWRPCEKRFWCNLRKANNRKSCVCVISAFQSPWKIMTHFHEQARIVFHSTEPLAVIFHSEMFQCCDRLAQYTRKFHFQATATLCACVLPLSL